MAGAGQRAMRARKSKTYVELEGQEEFRRALAGLRLGVLRELKARVQESAEVIEAGAKARVPVDEGTTHDSIKIIYRDGGLAASIGSGYFVARFVEQGVNGRPAKPFLNPAFQQERAKYLKGVEDAVSTAGREASQA